MTAESFTALLELLSGTKSTLGLLLLILITNFFEMWVWGKAHRVAVNKLERERDRWQALALSTTSLAREALFTQVQSQAPPGGSQS